MAKLNDQQKRAADQYLIHGEKKRAYMEAGYKATGASAEAAAVKLFKQPAMQQYIAERQAALAERAGLDQVDVLNQLAKIGFFDPRRLFDETGRLLPIHEIPPEIAAGITSIELLTAAGADGGTEVLGTTKIKFADRVKPLELIGKQLGMFIHKSEVKHSGTLEHFLAELSGLPTSSPMERLRARSNDE